MPNFMTPGRRQQAGLRWPAAFISLLVLTVVMVYLPLFNAGWLYDDANLVRPSPALENLAGLARAATTDLYTQAGARLEQSAYWRPLALASFWLDTRIGEPPRALHVGNILLHAIAAALLALVILRRIGGTGGLVAALLAAAWWALHPQSVEVVAWISCRYEILTAIALLGLLLLPRRQGLLDAGLFGLVFLAGLLAKESFVAVLAVALALEFAERSSLRQASLRWGALALALALWFGLRTLFEIKSLQTPPPAAVLAIGLNYLEALALYFLRAFAFPPLTISHPFASEGLRVLAGGLILVAFTTLGLCGRRARPEVTQGQAQAVHGSEGQAQAFKSRRAFAVPVVIFLAGLVPMAGAITMFAEAPERYFYLPSIGLALLLAEVIAFACAHRRRSVRIGVPAVIALLVIAGLMLVERRLPAWQSETSLWASALAVDPLDAQANYSIALAAGRKGDWGEARRALQVAVQGKPDSARIANAYAWVLVETGDFRGATRAAKRATELAPFDPNGWYYLAFASHRSGDHEGELGAVKKLLEVAPNYPGVQEMHEVATCEVQGGSNCLRGR